jgi:phosphoribosylformimino-5-aminoimidazole carboxamide ribotide isomerase
MLIFPAIDLKNGQVVRLRQGDFATVHQVAEDPLAVARSFAAAGARHVHVVDLDGAKDGRRQNSAIVRAVAQTGLRIELGGGLRTLLDIEEVFALGVHRAVIGSAAVSQPELVREAVRTFGGDRIAVGIDVKDGRVRTAGWVEDSGLPFIDFARRMEDLGVEHLIFTDIDTDGTLTGPAYRHLAALQQAVSCRLTASGGISCSEEIRRLRDMGLHAAIIGKAYYTGAIDLAQAVKDGGPQ